MHHYEKMRKVLNKKSEASNPYAEPDLEKRFLMLKQQMSVQENDIPAGPVSGKSAKKAQVKELKPDNQTVNGQKVDVR